MSEASELLAAMLAELKAIRLAIETRSVPKKPSKRRRFEQLRDEALETIAEKEEAAMVVRLWGELCPRCAQPIELDGPRRKKAREFLRRLGGTEGVSSFFLTIAADDWLSGRPCGPRRLVRTRPLGLFEAIDHASEILERTYH